ncbi:MAG: polysaccharide deacetylase family protein [Chromatiaceae bacterium]|nr:polysaccharide deacetylase family protein [Chromatiaceae bacterium]
MIARLAAHLMRRARHHTLIFHRVLVDRDPMNPSEPTADWFRRLAAMLATNFRLISLDEAVRRSSCGDLPGRTVSVTFDDGYADNYTVAMPILAEFGIPATFFVASGFIDGGRMWNDSIIETMRRLHAGRHELDLPDRSHVTLTDWNSRREAASLIIAAWKHLEPADRQARVDQLSARVNGLPTDLMLTTQQLRALAAAPASTIGGHTRLHPILASLSDAQAREEIERGRRELEETIQTDVTLFAYPNGKRGKDYRAEHVEMVRQAGFHAAVATDWGTLDAATDRFEIPRFTPWHSNLDRFSVDLVRCHFGLI